MSSGSARASIPTRADRVLSQIRLDILNGQLEPGARLGFSDLGTRYAVSTGVLREVLPRLVEQGLATSEPQLGFRVIEVSVDRLSQLTEARVAIETLVTRAAVADGDLAWEADVVAKHHALVRLTEVTSTGKIHADWIVAHEQFHLSILSGCANSYLFDIARRLRSVAEVYRCWSAPEQELAHRDLAAEHRGLMDAAISRQADLAAERTDTHIRRTTELLIAAQATRHPAS